MLGIVFAILCASFFAFNYILIQKGMKQSANDDGVFMNLWVNVLLLGIIYVTVLIWRGEAVPWRSSAIIAFVAAGLFTSLAGRSFLFAGIRRIGSSKSAAIKNSAPIFTILIAVLFLGERIPLQAGLGIILILGGLFLMAYMQWKRNGMVNQDDKVWLGLVFAALSAFSFGTGQAIRKLGLEMMPDPVFGAWLGTIVALSGYSLNLARKRELKTSVKQQFRPFNVYFLLAGVCTTGGVLSFFLSISFTQVAYTSALVATEPLLTILFAHLFLKKQEVIERTTVISSLLVFGGIVAVSLASAF